MFLEQSNLEPKAQLKWGKEVRSWMDTDISVTWILERGENKTIFLRSTDRFFTSCLAVHCFNYKSGIITKWLLWSIHAGGGNIIRLIIVLSNKLLHPYLNWYRCYFFCAMFDHLYYSKIFPQDLNCYHHWVFDLCLTIYLIKKIKVISYVLLWFDLSIKEFEIWLILLYIRINILNKMNGQTYCKKSTMTTI
jgi:hypothetical protein